MFVLFHSFKVWSVQNPAIAIADIIKVTMSRNFISPTQKYRNFRTFVASALPSEMFYRHKIKSMFYQCFRTIMFYISSVVTGITLLNTQTVLSRCNPGFPCYNMCRPVHGKYVILYQYYCILYYQYSLLVFFISNFCTEIKFRLHLKRIFAVF